MFYFKAKIKKIFFENKTNYTIELEMNEKKEFNPLPGQFFMLMHPCFGEKPFGVNSLNPFTVTISIVGPFTKNLSNIKKGDLVFIRGPYGKPFDLSVKKPLIVSGGVGLAPLRFLIDHFNLKKISTKAIIGFKNKDFILKSPNCKTLVCTDDGSFSSKGFVTDFLVKELKNKKYDCVFTCGPKIMMQKVGQICDKNNIKCQLLLEKYIKCGNGICGHCSINGFLVCKDGPCFDYSFILANMPSFFKEE